MVLTPEEFSEWRQLDVTKIFFKALFNAREKLKEDYILDLYEEKGKAVGKAQILFDLININYEELQEMLSKKES